MTAPANPTLTAVPGLRVGHATDALSGTGCTVVLPAEPAIAAASVRGGAVGSRQFSALQDGHVGALVHGVLFAGGSAYGLDATGGVLAFLEEQGVGLPTPGGRVPVVPTAVIYDLGLGDGAVRPGAPMGRAACQVASAAPVGEGSVGAGTGATIGKMRGVAHAMKGGVGSWAVRTEEGLVAAALVVVNAFGDVRDSATGAIVAGARTDDGGFLDSGAVVRRGVLRGRLPFGQNTTLAVVATNARLSRDELSRAADLAALAFPACISPVHTFVDGDLVVALSCGEAQGELHQVGLLWEDAIRVAILRAVRAATGLHGVPSASELGTVAPLGA